MGASSLLAGNIALTGHDSDFHFSLGNAASNQVQAMITFARAGAPDKTLPVLTFDKGTQLTRALTALGIPFTNVNPNLGIPDASLFDVTKYSAIAVASDSSCGGCDNDTVSSTNITGASAAIAAFFNAGGGIVAFAAGRNTGYYAFVPASASGFGNPPSSGYVQTAYGASIGIPAVNGNATHNFFFEPGTGGVSAAYGVVERLGDPNTGTVETIACAGCTVAGGGLIGGGGEGAVPVHPVTCFSGPVTTDVPVSGAITSTLPAPVIYQITRGNLGFGLRMDSAGNITGTPGIKGNFPYTVSVTDGTATITHTSCILTVYGPQPVPTITTACPLNSGVVGTALSQTLATSGGVGALSYSLATGSLPAGLTLSPAGVVSGTPTGAESATFTLQVTDSGTPVQTATKACSMVIAAAPVAPTAPVITMSCPFTPGTVAIPYHLPLTATSASAVTWRLVAGALPGGLVLQSGGGIVGTPTTAGTFSFTLTATNSIGSTTLSCSIVIAPAAGTPPTINNACPLSNATVGTPYSASFSSTGGVAPLSYTISSGATPGGLTLSSGGVLAGTPTTAGASSFTVLVTDSTTPTALTGSKACSLTVDPAPVPATAPTITTACPLPNGTERVHYSQTIAATGGTAPYTFAITGGALPRPLTLTSGGLLAGAPYHAGVYSFTLQVTGANSLSSTQSCSMTVAAPASAAVFSRATRGDVLFGAAGEDGVVPVGFELAEAMSVRVTGRAYLTGGDAEATGFVTGGREADFVIEAGETKARFSRGNFGITGGNGSELNVSVVLDLDGTKISVETAGTETRSRSNR